MKSTFDTDQASLEIAVAQAAASGAMPVDLFTAAEDFLKRRGESAVMANWIKDMQMAEGRPGQPHEGQPEVTVVVPCHNYGEYLWECVQSIVCQSFRAWELIIVNDGSTDNTHEVAQAILAAHPGHSIRYYQQQCKGIVQPRNRGVTLAKGEFILPLDADDLLAPRFLECTVSHLRQRPDLGYVSTKALFFGCINKIWPAEPLAPLALLSKNQQTNTTLFRKVMWQDVGGYDERMIHGYMDWEFWIRCTKMGWLGEQIDKPLFFYRRKADSVVMRAKKRDVAIKEQIVRQHLDIYNPGLLPTVRDEIKSPNWIPPRLIRSPLSIRKRMVPLADQPLKSGEVQDKVGRVIKLQVLDVLGHILPELAPVFRRAASEGALDDRFEGMEARLSDKVRSLREKGATDKALEIAAMLVGEHPLNPRAALTLLCALTACGNFVKAFEAARFYASALSASVEVTEFLAQLLSAWAANDPDPHHALGLLDGACLLAPGDANLAAALRTQRQGLGLPLREQQGTSAPVWYVSDSFGHVSGGVNGVTQAKYSTLCSLLHGLSGPDICVVTPLRPELPEAMADLAVRLARVCGPGNFRWPRWVATSPHARPEDPLFSGTQHPVRLSGPSPACIIVEGIRLDAHNYLETLGLPEGCLQVFVHHASPDQYKKQYIGAELTQDILKALANYQHCVSVSRNVMTQWKTIASVAGKTWTLIPNCAREEDAADLLTRDPAHMRRILGLPQNAFIILCLASVQLRKGQDILLSQAAEFLHHLPEAVLLFVGPVLSQWGGQEIVDLGRKQFSPQQVQFLGSRQNPLEYVHASDCLVLPSREEALPLTILEAMMLSKPCVASNVNGIPEMVEDGETGLLFSHDSPRDLAKHLLRLGQDARLRHTMGQNALQRYRERFSRDAHVRNWRKLLDSLIARR